VPIAALMIGIEKLAAMKKSLPANHADKREWAISS